MVKRKLAVDFGNSSTLIGVWDEPTKRAVMLEIPPYSHVYAMEGPDSDTFITPSLILYHNTTNFLVGRQVLEHASRGGVGTLMSQLKSRFIQYKIQSGPVDSQTAATDFLATVLLAAKKLASLDDSSEIILTNPVAAFEPYKVWLQGLSSACGFQNIRLLDEPVAAALTLVNQVNDGDVYLIFDYGAYSLDLALVRFTKQDKDNVCERIDAEVLENTAGDAIDSWLTEYAMERHADVFQNLDPLKVASHLTKQCKFAKQLLSRVSRTTVELALSNEPLVRFELTRSDLRSVLESKKLLEQINAKLDSLFRKSHSVEIGDVSGVLLVGGSSYLPAVQTFLKEIFGAEKIFAQSPIQAVVHGATLYASGAQIFDHIHNFYAFKYMDGQEQRFKPVVKPYTDYPYDGKEPIVVYAV
ncbi:MAG: Hsp70 family protein, partial [Candidatus Obscuribacterales bacterium]|nr:Hsp70 family protein [Candidatus Obscuribacterales bacterium]